MAIIYKCVLVALSSKITISQSAKFKLFLQASFPFIAQFSPLLKLAKPFMDKIIKDI